MGAGDDKHKQVSDEYGQVQVMTKSPPFSSSSSSSSSPFHYLAKCMATSIDVCVLLSRGRIDCGGARTHGYNVYHGFSWHTAGDTVRCIPVPATGTVYAGTGTV